jgi:hypothetical protein
VTTQNQKREKVCGHGKKMSQTPPSACKSGPLKCILNNLNAPERNDLNDGAKPGNLGKKSDHKTDDGAMRGGLQFKRRTGQL